MTNVVKYFHSAMTDAPVLNGVAGTFASLLDAVLNTGFGLRTASSVVVAGNIATMNFASGHPFEVDSVILVAGATPSGLNGEKRVLTVGANTVTFAAPGISDQTATGTITAKYAPLGFDIAFTGTNLRVYRSPNIESTRCYLRVDDTGTLDARVVGYESMSDINTGTGPFPTAAQISGGGFWPKASTTAATARAWTIIGDDKGFWFYSNTHVTTASLGLDGTTYGFGDFLSRKSGDAYACAMLCATATVGASTAAQATTLSQMHNSATASLYVARSYTALGTSLAVIKRAENFCTTDNVSGNVNQAGVYPNGPDNSLILSRVALLEPSPQCVRGVLRGALYVMQLLGTTTFNWRDKIDGQGALAGRKLMALKGAAPAGSAAVSTTTFIDITGPWE